MLILVKPSLNFARTEITTLIGDAVKSDSASVHRT